MANIIENRISEVAQAAAQKAEKAVSVVEVKESKLITLLKGIKRREAPNVSKECCLSFFKEFSSEKPLGKPVHGFSIIEDFTTFIKTPVSKDLVERELLGGDAILPLEMTHLQLLHNETGFKKFYVLIKYADSEHGVCFALCDVNAFEQTATEYCHLPLTFINDEILYELDPRTIDSDCQDVEHNAGEQITAYLFDFKFELGTPEPGSDADNYLCYISYRYAASAANTPGETVVKSVDGCDPVYFVEGIPNTIASSNSKEKTAPAAEVNQVYKENEFYTVEFVRRSIIYESIGNDTSTHSKSYAEGDKLNIKIVKIAESRPKEQLLSYVYISKDGIAKSVSNLWSSSFKKLASGKEIPLSQENVEQIDITKPVVSASEEGTPAIKLKAGHSYTITTNQDISFVEVATAADGSDSSEESRHKLYKQGVPLRVNVTRSDGGDLDFNYVETVPGNTGDKLNIAVFVVSEEFIKVINELK